MIQKIKLPLSMFFFSMALIASPEEDGTAILQKIDKNMYSESIIMEGKMIVYTKRSSREICSKSYTRGELDAFTEYLSPEREKGTKMLKLNDRLWIYSPMTDRTIQISGHMLRQSVMGSDLSYEDMMEKRKLEQVYTSTIEGTEEIEGRKCLVLSLKAKVEDVAYHSRKIWVDEERNVPLREDLFAKSGQLLKRTLLSDITKIGRRWYPKKINYKDMLKKGKGTDFIVQNIQFDVKTEDRIFSKASLTK